MRGSDNRAALTDIVAQFQAEVRRLALAIAREIVGQEIDLRAAKLLDERRGAGQPTRKRTRQPTQQRESARPSEPTAPRQLELELGSATGPSAAASVEAPTEQPSAPRAAAGKRAPWTRERIIDELATWMRSGTTVDAAFVARHGPPGLVAAARRVFGRFDAAMNVVGIHVAKLYPEGPPKRAW